MSGHTPGPWRIEDHDEQGELYENGVRIEANEGPVAFDVIDCSAHLIAAAPELLAALKLLLQESIEFMDDGGEWDGYRTKGMKAAKKAINKAEGRLSE
jgi:hypothetical protein